MSFLLFKVHTNLILFSTLLKVEIFLVSACSMPKLCLQHVADLDFGTKSLHWKCFKNLLEKNPHNLFGKFKALTKTFLNSFLYPWQKYSKDPVFFLEKKSTNQAVFGELCGLPSDLKKNQLRLGTKESKYFCFYPPPPPPPLVSLSLSSCSWESL